MCGMQPPNLFCFYNIDYLPRSFLMHKLFNDGPLCVQFANGFCHFQRYFVRSKCFYFSWRIWQMTCDQIQSSGIKQKQSNNNNLIGKLNLSCENKKNKIHPKRVFIYLIIFFYTFSLRWCHWTETSGPSVFVFTNGTRTRVSVKLPFSIIRICCRCSTYSSGSI